ncbi:DUF2207 domain-containing protein [Companilactobacillus halodurans]|uniref:DUF2207 domain-containing protein n=1 Tax=Companilactobacillus halodurans TaxID=2584183 RepID=A0A5P0ZY17_9LACO|nr:DUF2207 domain-containing protein [Companilactobacillus halodurans]MQS75795.1 DUF2207 domain-containing protein [Companilactobacillus halodurans]MQS97993.1 DUF2207 domain-containing protein [Companilactobacillus halodurans]
MKKLWGIIFAVLGVAIFFQSATTVKADDYTIKQYFANADILKNGDIDLTQRVTYRFNGDFHGVYYNQDIQGIKGMSKPQVYYEDSDQDIKPLVASDSGQNDTFKVTKSNKQVNIKVYHDVSFQKVTYIYKYKLNGAITNYLDTAEMNWKMIGSGWDQKINKADLQVNLPQKNVSKLQAWTHGPLNGTTKVSQKNGQVKMTIDNLPSNQFVESHIIFPTAVTADNKNVINKKAKASVLKHEKRLAQAANAKRNHKIWIYRILMILGFAVILIIYLYHFISLKKHPTNKHIIPTPLHHFFDEPKFLPSMTQIVLNHTDKADAQALTADLLYEVGQHHLKIEKIGIHGKNYEITALTPPTNAFFKYLIEEIGNGESVTLNQIKGVARSSEKFVTLFENWSKDAAEGREKYLDFKNINIMDNFRVAAIASDVILFIMIMINILFERHILLFSTIAVILMIAVWIIYWYLKKKITLYTDEGEVEVNQIRAFKRMLNDIDDIKMAEVGDVILWEQFLPYAVVFGVSDKVIKALKLNFSTEQLDQSMVIPFYIGAGGFLGSSSTGFQSSFTSAITASGSSSVVGGSGGFSGGSSGGFGGGSGGGAF